MYRICFDKTLFLLFQVKKVIYDILFAKLKDPNRHVKFSEATAAVKNMKLKVYYICFFDL
jgi:hypothetical protein